MVIQKKEEEKHQEEEQEEEEEEERKAWHGLEKKTEHRRIPFHKILVDSPPRWRLSPSLSDDDVDWGEIGPPVWEMTQSLSTFLFVVFMNHGISEVKEIVRVTRLRRGGL